MFWFILFVILTYLLLNSASYHSNTDGWQKYYESMHQLADKIEYGKQQQEINKIIEKYKLEKDNWDKEVSFKYSQTKNCINIKTYGLLLKQLVGLDGLILESYHRELSRQIIFVLHNSAGTQVRHIVNEERLMALPNHIGQYEFIEDLINKWLDKQKELERNPCYDILER